MTSQNPRIPASKTTLTTPPNTLSTPAFPYSSPGVFTVHNTTRIAASPQKCLSTILDTASYSRWNAFCPEVIITNQPNGNSDSDEVMNSVVQDNSLPTDPTTRSTRTNEMLRLGTKFTFIAFMDGTGLQLSSGEARKAPYAGQKGGRPTHLTVSELCSIPATEAGGAAYRVAWKGSATGLAKWALHSERVHELRDDGVGGCVYENWETFVGPVSYVVKWFFGNALVDRFGDWSHGLKTYLEAGR